MTCVVCGKVLERWEYPNRDKFTGTLPAALCDGCAREHQVWPVKTGESHERAQDRLGKEFPGWP